LLQPKYQVLQVARLIQVFAPIWAEASWLPATLEASQMAAGLPLPSANPLKKRMAQRTGSPRSATRSQ